LIKNQKPKYKNLKHIRTKTGFPALGEASAG